ncbi:MAG: ATP-dependent Clp protease adaptor ClpS [Leptospira sp.]|nr:ATP-dependent Clp protease adaptor ClpS [Leptospira sp.]
MNPIRKIDILIEDEILIDRENIYFQKVILHNDTINEFSHVEDCIMKICYKTKREAKRIAMEAHSNGKAICFVGSLEECETVYDGMNAEGLTVTIQS